MSKKLIPLLIVALLIVLMLAGCESTKYGPIPGGDANAIVSNNGGLAVRQGDYLYFVNGFSDYDSEDPKTNFFGNVVKGAIMRGTLAVDGTLTDVVTVVPKKVMSTSTDTGISVFGNWIYYVSPSTGTDNKGNVLTDYIDFYRTSIDGSDTEKITRINGNATEYKFTSKALVYYLDKKLVSIDLTSKKFKETTIDEEVVSILFPDSSNYDPANPSEISDYIFYTKASESELDSNNVVYSVNANGSNKKTLIDKATYVTTENPNDLTNIFTISLLSSSITGNNVAIYYTKKAVGTMANQDRGLYGYEFSDTNFTFSKANEKCFSLTTTTKIYPISFTKGVLILDATPNVLAFAALADQLPVKVEYEFPASITVLGVSAIEGVDYVYYLASSKLNRFPLDKSENAAVIIDSVIKTGWAGPDFINGVMYYVNEEYNYTYMVKLNTYDISDTEAIENILIGQMNDVDKAAKEAADKKAAEEAAAEED